MAEHWKEEPEEHDFPAARRYLSLLVPGPAAEMWTDRLREAETRFFKAKDLLRASGLALLPTDNPHVASDLAKVKKGQRLSPVLLLRGELEEHIPLTVADGYHRICASYHLDENADIPCRLVELAPRS